MEFAAEGATGRSNAGPGAKTKWHSIVCWAWLVAGLAITWNPVPESWNRLLYDMASRAAASTRQELNDDVVVVALDQATLDQVSAPMALMHRELGVMLEALSASGAKAVAVDIVLPDRSFESLIPGLDGSLVRGILLMRRVGPVVLGRTVDEAGRSRPIAPQYVSAAGPSGIGLAMFEAEGDGVVRRFEERLGIGGEMVPTLVGELARRLGHSPSPGLIDFTRPTGSPTVALQDVLARFKALDSAKLARDFSGKVVFVGLTLPFIDRLRIPAVPAPDTLSGVHVHVQAYRSVRDGRLIQDSPGWINSIIGILCASTYMVYLRVRRTLAFVFGTSVLLLAQGYVLLLVGWALPVATFLTLVWAATASRLARELFAEVRAKRRLQSVFAGYVSPDVMKELESGRLTGVGSERRHIAVLFIDVRGFTSRSERTPPERVTATLNAFFELVTASIHCHGGTVKEFMGDGVMSFFGAPKDMKQPAREAYQAAREIHAALPLLNRQLEATGEEPLVIGMGLASGQAVVGHIGSPSRHAYGAMGDCVNVAARLESMTKELGYPLLMSRDAAAELEGVSLISLGRHGVKGHSPIEIIAWRG